MSNGTPHAKSKVQEQVWPLSSPPSYGQMARRPPHMTVLDKGFRIIPHMPYQNAKQTVDP